MVTESNIYCSFVSCFQDVFSSGHGTLCTLRISVYDALHFSRFVSILQHKSSKYRKRSYVIYFGAMKTSSLNMIYLIVFNLGKTFFVLQIYKEPNKPYRIMSFLFAIYILILYSVSKTLPHKTQRLVFVCFPRRFQNIQRK